jgi:hypothetical protein
MGSPLGSSNSEVNQIEIRHARRIDMGQYKARRVVPHRDFPALAFFPGPHQVLRLVVLPRSTAWPVSPACTTRGGNRYEAWKMPANCD